MAVLLKQDSSIGRGFGGRTVEFGTATLAAGTVEVVTKLRNVEACFITAIGAAAATESFSLNETVTNGKVVVPAGNSLTIDSDVGASTATVSFILIGN